MASGSKKKENKHDYFINIKYNIENYQEDEPLSYYELLNIKTSFDVLRGASERPRKKITKQRRVVAGFDQTVDVPYKAIRINKRPKLENLPWWAAFVVPVVSKVTVRLFYSYAALREKTWGEWEIAPEVAWQTVEMDMKGEQHAKTLDKILQEFEKTILASLMEKYKHLDEQPVSSQESRTKPDASSRTEKRGKNQGE